MQLCSFNVESLWCWFLKFLCKHRRPIEKCLRQNCQFACLNKRLSPGAIWFVFSLCRQVSQKDCAIVYFVWTYSAWVPFAYLLFIIRTVRQAGQNYVWPRHVCPPWIWIIVGMVSHLNLRGRSAIFVLFRSRAGNFWMSGWDSYRQGSPIFVPMSVWRLQYLFSKFANSCYSGCVRQSCHNLYLMLDVTTFFVCLRRDSPEVVLFTAKVAKNSYSFPAWPPQLNFYRNFVSAKCHYLIRLIATFDFGWLPPLILLIAIAWSGQVPHYLGLGASNDQRDHHNWIPIAFLETADGQTFLKTADGQTFFLEILTPRRRTRESVW